ncbi:MAG: PKD domain-containing protein [Candidatus Woesearchaeota archaeon]
MTLNKKGRMMMGILLLILIAVFSSAALSLAADGVITIKLAYAGSPGIDSDNNGIENYNGAIDFTAAGTQFSWAANQSNLCTLWRILPEGQGTATLICYGASHCCSFADLSPSASNWDEIFYLYPGAYGVASKATVSAKVVYVDYQLSPENIYADIQFSEWGSLSAEFTQQPFSTFSAPAAITVLSPDNSTALSSGEITLAVRLDGNSSLLYSLDGAANVTAQGNITEVQSNYSALLLGSLQGGVISNGIHTLLLYADSGLQLEHPFTVADTFAPLLAASLTNNTMISNTNLSYNLSVQADEIANISYALNSANVTQAAAAAKTANFTIIPSVGKNNLTITAQDMHGNARSYYYNFTFALSAQGSCQDTVQNYHDGMNETGIDCGGTCSACVQFNVSLDKQSYLSGELVFINVQARQDAMHNITITGPGYRTSFTYNGSTYYVVSPPSLGNYTVNVSLNYRNLTPEYLIRYFSLVSNDVLAVSINANATTINRNETVAFSAAISGNKSAVSIKWDLNNDSVTDSTSANVNYTYLNAGDFLAKLNVSDSTSSRLATAAITVRPFYNVTINATDKNFAAISSAVIRINGETKSISPTAYFNIPAKSYDVEIGAPGYLNRTSSISVSENSSFSYILYRDDTHPPLITLVRPDDNATLSQDQVNLVFTVQDETQANCSLILYNGSLWLRQGSIIVADSGEHNFTPSLEAKNYIWRVECADEAQNSNTSELRTFTVSGGRLSDLTASSAADRVDQIITVINQAILAVDSYGKLEQEAAVTLKLKESLEKAKTELQRAVRDISNVKWRRLNSTDEAAFIEEALNSISLTEGNITTGVTVIKNAKFVSYPDNGAVEEAGNAYLSSILKHPTKTELDQYISDNKKIQQGVVVTTDYKVVELKTFSGVVKAITLIEKSLEYNTNMSDIMLLEVIPKNVVDSAKKINALFGYAVIKEDPVISVELPDGNKYAYYVEDELTQNEAQSIQSVVLSKSLKPVAESPTGFAVFSIQGLKDPKVRFIVEIVVALALLALYITYSRGMLKFSRQSKDRKNFNSLVEQIRTSMQQNNYDRAKELYKGIQQNFKQLKPEEKKAVYDEVADLYHELDAKYVKKRIDEANVLLAHGQKPAALAVYAELTRVYKTLPQQYKKEIYNSCMELHNKLGAQK